MQIIVLKCFPCSDQRSKGYLVVEGIDNRVLSYFWLTVAINFNCIPKLNFGRNHCVVYGQSFGALLASSTSKAASAVEHDIDIGQDWYRLLQLQLCGRQSCLCFTGVPLHEQQKQRRVQVRGKNNSDGRRNQLQSCFLACVV